MRKSFPRRVQPHPPRIMPPRHRTQTPPRGTGVPAPLARLSEPLKQAPPGATAGQARSAWTRLVLTLRVLQVRLRFFVVLLVAFVVVGKWDVLRNYWDRLTRGRTAETMHAASADTEYYCPMGPGGLSDRPSKWPVVYMHLAR